MLQAFATQCGASRRGTQQEAARALVSGRPDGVADTLKAKHRVIDVERQHGQAMHAVAGGRCRPAGDGTGLADALFQNLAIERLAVAEHRADVFRLVALADAGINANLLEQIGHAKGARLVGHDGHDARAQLRVLQQVAQHAHKGHGGGHFLAGRRRGKRPIAGQRGHRHHRHIGLSARQVSAQAVALLVQVAHLGAVVGGFEKLQVCRLGIREWQVEAVAVFDQRGLVELFLAVRGHLALTGLTHAIAFLGVGQNDGGLATVLQRGAVGGVNFDNVVAAAFEAVNLFVRHPLGQAFELFVLAKEAVTVEAPILGGKGLHLAVHGVGKGLDQRAGQVACKQAVPIAAPDQFDDVPTGTAKQFFQLVNNAAIAPHRAVQPLQVAVDHPHQVIQLLARSQCQSTHAFGFVHFAITKHAPDLARRAVQQLAVRQVAHEARVVD